MSEGREKHIIDFGSGIWVCEILTAHTAFPIFDVTHCDTVRFLGIHMYQLGPYRDCFLVFGVYRHSVIDESVSSLPAFKVIVFLIEDCKVSPLGTLILTARLDDLEVGSLVQGPFLYSLNMDIQCKFL